MLAPVDSIPRDLRHLRQQGRLAVGKSRQVGTQPALTRRMDGDTWRVAMTWTPRLFKIARTIASHAQIVLV